MSLQDNIYKYRKEKGYSQEELGVLCHVSRQAVSKWENGSSKPDSDNLVLLAKFLEISTDTLLDIQPAPQNIREDEIPPYYEITYTSKLKIFTIPLIDIYFRIYHFHYYRSVLGRRVMVTKKGRCAKGIIAIGTKAMGVFTLSFFGLGVFGIGLFNIGLLASFGVVSLSAMYAFGVIALSLYFAFGVAAVGSYVFGVTAYGAQIAFGVATFGKHTIGILASGTYPYAIQDGTTCIIEYEQFQQLQLLLKNTYMPELFRFFLSLVQKC